MDKCHHGEEEQVLFPLLREKPLKPPKIIDVLLREHEKGRPFVRKIKAGAEKEAAEGAREYAALLPDHIMEENTLFKKANALLDEDEKKELFEEFEKIEREIVGEGKHEEYLEKAKELKEKLGRF